MSEQTQRVVPLLCMLFLVFSISLLDGHLQSVLSATTTSTQKFTVVIDAGHGGFDSGKVSPDGILEKDVNLSIAKKLETLLTSADINVIMTRTDDTALGETSSSGKKQLDMNARIALMNETAPDCIVSIHQNSYPDPAIDGAQVFYYTPSAEGKIFAALLQQQLIASVDPSNHRKEKSNDSYYLLKHANAPIVIAECGFLSNPLESKKLVDDAYQHKLAWAIHLGILQYLNVE